MTRAFPCKSSIRFRVVNAVKINALHNIRDTNEPRSFSIVFFIMISPSLEVVAISGSNFLKLAFCSFLYRQQGCCFVIKYHLRSVQPCLHTVFSNVTCFRYFTFSFILMLLLLPLVYIIFHRYIK